MTLLRKQPDPVRKGKFLPSVHFSLPGNVRWNCPVLYANSRLSRQVEDLLRGHNGITKVTANPVTGRLRVLYAPSHSRDDLAAVCESAIRKALDSEAIVVRMPSPAVQNRWASSEIVDADVPLDGLRPLLCTIAIGVGTVAAWVVAKAALRIFPRAAVFTGVAIFAGSTAALTYLLSRDPVDDRIKRERDHAVGELWRVSRPYRRNLAVGMILVALSRIFQAAMVAALGLIIDSVVSASGLTILGQAAVAPPFSLMTLGVLAAVAVAGCSLFDYYSRVIWMRAAHQIGHDLRLSLYGHIQDIQMSQITDAQRGNYLALLSDDINRVELLFSSMWGVSREVLYGVVSVVAFFLVEPAFTGMVAVSFPVLLLVAYFLEKQIRPRFAALREEAGELHGLLSSTLDGLETTRAFGTELRTLDWVARASARFQKEQNATLTIVTSYDPSVIFASNALRLVTCIAAGFYMAAGNMTLGSYVSIMTLANSLALPLRGLANDFPHILSTLASLSRVFRAFDIPIEDRNEGLPVVRENVKGHLRFQKISFAYPTGQSVFSDFSVEIPAGRVTAFVGATGSGKSTLAKLLLRFYDPDAGHISMDDRDIEQLGRVQVRHNIGYVGQDVFLFNGSIRDNIALGWPEADLESVKEAARIAGAHDFISSLPAGYDALTGERGLRLSGGERQRVGIARALLLRNQIVILDEATSALDPVTEANLLTELTAVLAGKTVIVIAHRLSAVRNADRIHVIESGHIREAGSHEELLRLGGKYARYWALQTHDMDAFGRLGD